MTIDIKIEEIKNTAYIYNEHLKRGITIDEENTKNTLILPLLAYLGHNIFSINEIYSEYPADLRYVRNAKNADKVDYAIMCNSQPRVFIECKKFGEDLSCHVGQLRQYFATNVNVSHAILTNGNDYWLFSDYDYRNIMDETPYKKIKLTEASIADIYSFEDFRRKNISTL